MFKHFASHDPIVAASENESVLTRAMSEAIGETAGATHVHEDADPVINIHRQKSFVVATKVLCPSRDVVIHFSICQACVSRRFKAANRQH